MNTTRLGRTAEAAAAKYLVSQGFTVIAQNWRTRWCEIDIVAVKDRVVSLVEVKYRRRETWGSGLEYINAAKLRQMRLAARFWTVKNHWEGDYCLAAIEVSGPSFQISNFLPDCI